MAGEIRGFSWTLESAADYRTSNGMYRFVKVTTAGKAQQAGAGEVTCGVRQNTPNTSEAMTIASSGISLVESGAAVTAGDLVGSDASGRAILATTGQYIGGIALATASTSGILIPVKLLENAAKA